MRVQPPELTASEALSALRKGELSARDYVQALLLQAQRFAHLNSLIAVDAAGALSAAARIDALRAAGGPMSPLLGLPLIVKDNIDFAGMPTTGGTPALRDWRPRATAPALQRLLDAGAILLGKANMHELAFGVTSTNFSAFAGAVRNPRDTTRVAGGSSGGTAAALAAGIAPAGLGTDTGGSVRIPAAFCGLAGLRPSVGNGAERRYDGRGVLPISHTRDAIGPMARTMADVALLDSVMSGEPIAEPATLAGVRFGVASLFWDGMEGAVAKVMDQALSRLQSAGAILVDVDLAELAALTAQAAFVIAVHEAGEDILKYLAASGGDHPGLSDIAHQVASPDVRRIVERVVQGGLDQQYQLAMGEIRPRMQHIYAQCFTAHRLDALVFPTVVLQPPLIDLLAGSTPALFEAAIRNTDPGSTAGLPGISVPAGLSADGLPVGIALDGPVGSDRRLVALGMAMEAVLPPPVFAGEGR